MGFNGTYHNSSAHHHRHAIHHWHRGSAFVIVIFGEETEERA
jgi:hypothetical protein